MEAASAPPEEKAGKRPSKAQIGDLGEPGPASFTELAEVRDPGDDEGLEAHRDKLTAKTGKAEAQAKADLVDQSPRAGETPSGAAVKAAAGIKNDVERGEAYAQAKAIARHGVLPVADVADAA